MAASIRATQVVRSVIAQSPPSPLRMTQVVRTLIVSPIIPPTPPATGCPASTALDSAAVSGSDGCAPADLVD